MEDTTIEKEMAAPCSIGVIVSNNAAEESAEECVKRSENWMRLTLATNICGTESIQEMMGNEFQCITNKKKFHSWLATAKKNEQEKKKKKKCLVNIDKCVWPKILGDCVDGCPPSCNGETDISKLDITSLRSIYVNLKHIIPSGVMSQNYILQSKSQFNVHVECVRSNRNYLAHYSLKMSMPKKVFKRIWISIRNALYGMGYTKIKKFDDLKTCFLYQHLREQVKAIKDTLDILENEKCDESALTTFAQYVDQNFQDKDDSAVFPEVVIIKGISSLIFQLTKINGISYHLFFFYNKTIQVA